MHDWYEKKWFVKIDEKELGPYCKAELRYMAKITPDTLCRLANESEWKPIKARPELRDLFEQPEEDKEKNKKQDCKQVGDELILDYSQDPSPFLFWLVIILLLLLIAFYPMFYKLWT